jgi:hypothetical protein
MENSRKEQLVNLNCVPFWVGWRNIVQSLPGCESSLCPVYPRCIYYLPISHLVAIWLSDQLSRYHSACVQVHLTMAKETPRCRTWNDRLTLVLCVNPVAHIGVKSIQRVWYIICGFRYPLGVLEHVPHLQGGATKYIVCYLLYKREGK